MTPQITLAHGRVITFEGAVDDVANAAFAAGLAGGRPRVWVRALLPERWAMVRRERMCLCLNVDGCGCVCCVVHTPDGGADPLPSFPLPPIKPNKTTLHQALDAVLLKGLAALLDVSFSLGALNLLPLYQLDGAHALHEAVRLLLHFLAKRRRGRSSGSGADPRSRLLAWYRRGVVAVGCLFAVNVLLAALAALEQAGLLGG